jgi:sterol desaturase/sphingolipid hydroxylase (fatty acid hydroxylase superfamily)
MHADVNAAADRENGVARFIDYAIPPAFLASTVAGTHLLLQRVPHYLVGSLVVGALAVAAAVLERVRPERTDYRKLDQPLVTDAAHFLLNYQLGYGLALGACAAIARWMEAHGQQPLWPTGWPLALQIIFAGLLAEGTSYWQHRLVHRVPWLWRFHALHHSGARLNLIRAGRFHFVDIGPGAFLVFVPLVVLGAPAPLIAWVASISGVAGILEHANMRMRTPAWLDWLVCTPAVHRHHHSRVLQESNRNFGTLIMLFDVLFGSYERPRAAGPSAMGIEDDPVPRGFWNQVMSPFRRTAR